MTDTCLICVLNNRLPLRKLLLTFLLPFAFLYQPLKAQQNNNWYFGRQAALNFNLAGNQPVPAVVLNSQMISNENCSTISDESGHLLFYTNGVDIYNRLHQVMQNGDNIGGNISACQSIIIPQPGNDSLFYIIATDAVENDFKDGYRYSIVNIKRNGGNGEVITKNILLWASCTERLTAVRHSNGVDVWLITNDFNSNIFRSWIITCQGLQTNPIVSTTGQVLDMHATTNTGVLKASPDGKQLCQTHFPFFDDNRRLPNFVQLFDFNNSSGVISNVRTINFLSTQYTHCAYSPDSKLLYLTRPYDNKIDQLEITLPTAAAIKSSRVELPTLMGCYDLQLAPDGKIYVAQPSRYLSVIHQPNTKGPGCNFGEKQIDLVTGSVFLGMPSIINDVSAFDPANGFNFTIVDSCSGTVQFNGFVNMPGVLSWAWDFGDGNISSLQNPTHVFTPATLAYTVKLKVSSSFSCAYIFRSKVVKPSGILSKVDFEIIEKCDSGYIRFVNKSSDPQNSGGQFTWDFGDGNTSTDVHPIHTYAAPGIYPVQLKLVTSTPCLNDSITKAVDLEVFTINVSPDQTIMVGESVQLFANGPGITYEWSPTTGLNNPATANPLASPLEDMVYTVTATDAAGCKSVDSVKVTVLQPDDFYVPTAFTPNSDGRNDNIKPFFPAKYNLKAFSIYTRWGQQIFSTSERARGWDGKLNGIPQNTGVYVWQIRAVDRSGVTIERKGTFVLIR